MNTLHLRITGLCAFVPKHSIDDPAFKQNNQMRVLCGDSSRPLFSPAGTPYPHELHMPVLYCQSGYVDSSGRPADATFQDPVTTYSVFYLDDQDLSIASAQPDALAVPQYPGGGTGTPNIANYRSFAWVPSLEQISPGSQAVKPACLTTTGAVDSAVVARVALTDGSIETLMIAKDHTNAIVNWEFRGPNGNPGGYQQVIADAVKFQTVFSTPVIELTTTLFRPSKNPKVAQAFATGASQPIRLRPSGNEVIAWIKNMPWPDIAGTRPKPAPGPRDPDYDFIYFYDLSTNPGKRNVPYQIGTVSGASGPHLGNPNCPPVRTAADPTT